MRYVTYAVKYQIGIALNVVRLYVKNVPFHSHNSTNLPKQDVLNVMEIKED